jgi:hypothetical protein
MMPGLAFSEETNQVLEPVVDGSGVIDLLEGGTLDLWNVPSNHWSIDRDIIVGDTGGQKIDIPEWLYTKQRFGDFQFTCELKLTGDDHRNTGIYFRVNTFLFDGQRGKRSFEAPSGYEFDAAKPNPTRKNNWGSLGDWYARPTLRVFADQTVISQVYVPEEWNPLTIRAQGNRLEYWINGIKVMDYLDHDPAASREGLIGFQIHNGSVMKLEYRNIRVLPL